MNLLYIGNKLSGRGLNVTTLETLSHNLTAVGYRVATASSQKNVLLRFADMLFSVFRYRKADYVLIDTYSTSAFWYAFAVSQLCRVLTKKYIPILHGGNLPYRLKQNPLLCSMIFGYAHQNIAPSHYLLHAFEKAGFTNVSFIPNSIVISQYPFKERKDIKPKLLWVRAFAALYNPKMAVDVLVALQRNYPDTELCMVGPDKDGSLEATRQYALQQGVAVTFTGQLSKADWTALAAEYDIFINTTNFDNTPVSVMEAMALGLPVVSTNVGGIPYLLEDGKDALLVNANDVSGMVSAIDALLTTSELAHTLSLQGRQKALNWDWESVKKLWIALLQ
ncbi:glycosyltransferase family 4 protein [Flavobacterium suncheonense]|uniref:glycosyltransferase family 4 protein n=1 Tax=Flavobacterium suncheonense TaxID=350894 RepID=UPI003FA3CA0B